jgi:hypothetical protein
LAAVIVAELIFRKVAVKVLLGTVLVDALHAALEDAERALDGVGVNVLATYSPAECLTVSCAAKCSTEPRYRRLSSVYRGALPWRRSRARSS